MTITHRVHRANEVDRPHLVRLKGLTNDPSRGDVRDDGSAGGSSLRGHLEDVVDNGDTFPRDCWIITASDDDGDVVGWCMVARSETSPNRPGFRVAAVGIYVAPASRRTGVASGLIREVSEVARKHGMTQLQGNPWNARGHSFFTSHGFVSRSNLPRAFVFLAIE